MIDFELRMNGRAVAKIEIDADLLGQLLQGRLGANGAAQAHPAGAPNGFAKSSPMTPAQASALAAHVDSASREFLKRIAEENGALTWGETKMLFDLKSWDDFTHGPGKKIEKELRRALDDKHATLIWRVESEWIGLEKGEDEVCRLHVDGAALDALKAALSA